jgi:S-adenosylmethionine:diacylglycerol 3-amino-3-carboxypropyl transferase
LHVVIFGTGKWARLIGEKVLSLSYNPIYLGTKSADFDRDNIPKNVFKDSIVFIASKTENHFKDVVRAIKLKPSKIFIEKGFSNLFERKLARYFCRKIDTGILNQYLYSNVFDSIIENRDKIISIKYNLTIDQDNLKEWAYHIVLINNFIRGKKISKYDFVYGPNTIDQVSYSFITLSNNRNFEIIVRLFNEEFRINLGRNNSIASKDTTLVYENEDCLLKQLKDVIFNFPNSRIERL